MDARASTRCLRVVLRSPARAQRMLTQQPLLLAHLCACARTPALSCSGASARGSGPALRASMSAGGGGDGEKPLTCLLEVSKDACDSIGALKPGS